MTYKIGTILRRKLLNSPVGWHYGAVIGYEYGIPIVFENTKGAKEQLVWFNDFAQGQEVLVEECPTDPPQVVIQRAREALKSPQNWDLFSNCEHSCRKITQGKSESIQLQSFFVITGLVSILVWASKS